MYRITIKGEAKTDYKNLKRLHGVSSEEEFSDYFGDDEQKLKDKGVCNGFMRFEEMNGKLWTITDYESDIKLTEEELDILGEYTQGQWSDGIGEGFEQVPCMYDGKKGIFISAWNKDQELVYEQIEQEGMVDRTHEINKREKEQRLNTFLKNNDISKILKDAKEILETLKSKK